MENNSNLVPLLCCLISGFIIIVPFSILVIVLINKGKKSAWEGTIIDKLDKTNTDDDGHLQHFYTLVVETKEKKQIKVGVSAAEFKNYHQGDYLVKQAGKFKPEKVTK